MATQAPSRTSPSPKITYLWAGVPEVRELRVTTLECLIFKIEGTGQIQVQYMKERVEKDGRRAFHTDWSTIRIVTKTQALSVASRKGICILAAQILTGQGIVVDNVPLTRHEKIFHGLP